MARGLPDMKEQALQTTAEAASVPAMLPQAAARWARVGRLLQFAGAGWLLCCTAMFFYWSRHWPLVNDAALMHYVVFLMAGGMAPYREIGDINLPGAYVPEWLSFVLASCLHVSSAAMWRAMDASVLLLAGFAMVRIARPFSWFAGVWAGCLFALYHGRDGVGQAGQRDLWMAMLLLWAMASLFAARQQQTRQAALRRLFAFGLLVGSATTIKPGGVAFLLCTLPFLTARRVPGRERFQAALAVTAGFLLPLFTAFLFVVHWHAV